MGVAGHQNFVVVVVALGVSGINYAHFELQESNIGNLSFTEAVKITMKIGRLE